MHLFCPTHVAEIWQYQLTHARQQTFQVSQLLCQSLYEHQIWQQNVKRVVRLCSTAGFIRKDLIRPQTMSEPFRMEKQRQRAFEIVMPAKQRHGPLSILKEIELLRA